MKKLLLFSLVFIGLLITSCKKDDNKKDSDLPLGTIEAKFNGTLKTFNHFSGGSQTYYQYYDMSDYSTALTEFKEQYNSERMSIQFFDVNWDTVSLPYTFQISYIYNTDYSAQFNYFNGVDGELPLVSHDGTITVTSKTDTEFEGTFQGIINNDTDTMVVTEGSFRVPYVLR